MSTDERRKRGTWWRWALGALVALVVVGAVFGSDDDDGDRASSDTPAETRTAGDGAPPAGEAAEPEAAAPSFEDAKALADDEKYDEAIALYASEDEQRIRAYVAGAIAATAVSALRKGDRRLAARRLRRAEGYGRPAAVVEARSELRAAQQRASNRRAAERRAAERREAEEQIAEEPPAAPEPDAPSVPAGTCSEIGITDFPVPPGDPRDRDGDGIACES